MSTPRALRFLLVLATSCACAAAVLSPSGAVAAASTQSGGSAPPSPDVKRQPSKAAPRSTVREYRRTFRTYPFSDPNPIANVGRVYPYYRFDGYTNAPVDKEWTVVELENEYLKVQVLPEIGGKIWAAFEKTTGRSFIYNNQVVKFRDIAMRGPWTSGGIEANYGIIGHTPNCATPVDYVVRNGPDGSAAVVIGALDLLTRTTWRIEIALPADTAYFTTRSFWHNGTSLEQPYYTWMNAAVKAAGNLELIYPGTHHLGHGGEAAPWPVDSKGRNLAFYEQNNFGPYKSYHVFGRRSEFFGAYWHDDEFGMGRYSRRDDKVGKKAWIWGLSRQGMIWEKLLTDEDGQYVEVQSGRLFNQSAEDSTFTPFKHMGFAPYAADTWTEYWFPVKGTGGFVKADEQGALNVRADGRRLTVSFSPLQRVDDVLEVADGDRVVYSGRVSLRPMQTFSRTIDAGVPADRVVVRIGSGRFEYDARSDERLSRPVAPPPDFDWDSVFGLYTAGKEWIRQREYGRAREALTACLRKDANYVPALADLAMLDHREMRDQAAWDTARRALSVDTYDPNANFVYGLASRRLGKHHDAKDGFEMAALSPATRAAAWTELARTWMAEGDLRRAEDYATRSVEAEPLNLDAHQVLIVAARLRADKRGAASRIERLLAFDPLNHFARFEQWVAAPGAAARARFVEGVRNEMPHETFLELAAWYRSVGRVEDARRLLKLSPPASEVLYWLAYLGSVQNDPAADEALRGADATAPSLVFPFRPESLDVFRWAAGRSSSWKPKYYLALLHWNLNDAAGARDLLTSCGNTPDYAPFYATRARALEPVSRPQALADIERAAALDPRGWRYGKLLVEHFIADGEGQRGRDAAARYFRETPGSHVLGLLYGRTLLLTGDYEEADRVLRNLEVLPFEGSTDGRALFRETQLMLAAADFRASRTDGFLARVASAREWPENLGAGKPYPEDTDERLEDWLQAKGLERGGRNAEATPILEQLSTVGGDKEGFGQFLAALAQAKTGRPAEAQITFSAWAAKAGDPRLVEWARRVFGGAEAPLPDGVVTGLEPRVFAAVR